jgi:plastocyanin
MIRYGTAFIALALISIISLSGCLNQGKPSAITVEIKNYPYSHYAFSPDKITVPAGTEIIWINNDSRNHTVTSDLTVKSPEEKFDSGIIKPGEKFSHTFKNPGYYSYYCKIHTYMKGLVIVN